MTEKLVTLKNLEEITQISTNTLRTYLRGYRFTKFERCEKIGKYRQVVYCFNQDFLDIFIEFLWTKRQNNAIERLKKYYKKEVQYYYD